MVSHAPATILLLTTLIAACSDHAPPVPQTVTPEKKEIQLCRDFYAETEAAIAAAQVIDSESARIPGYPYLRVDRFLTSFKTQVSDEQFDFWVDLMQQQAMTGWQVEMANLPEKTRTYLEKSENLRQLALPHLKQALHYCAKLLHTYALTSAAARNRLRERAVVPAEYHTWQRVVGLYPLTALAFRAGIENWHAQTRAIFSLPLQQLPVLGSLVQYVPAQQPGLLPAADVARIIARSSANPLHIPLLDDHDRQRLLDNFAPIFEVDEVSGQDRVGAPAWQNSEYPTIDTANAAVFRRISHTRLGDLVLLQLNYTIWFPSRPRTSSLDLLGGHLDGITWRVTLLPGGKPWLFDSIHNCGCYHLFFPGEYARALIQDSLYREPAFAPQPPLPVDNPARVVLRIAANTHYLQRIHYAASDAATQRRYHSLPYRLLRSLPLPDGGRRSLFREDGIVAGSERRERFLFWPMGIPNPGAMRQWGHHATAFVGRRHFDDAFLFAEDFTIVSTPVISTFSTVISTRMLKFHVEHS